MAQRIFITVVVKMIEAKIPIGTCIIADLLLICFKNLKIHNRSNISDMAAVFKA